jgi:hypothetical protein
LPAVRLVPPVVIVALAGPDLAAGRFLAVVVRVVVRVAALAVDVFSLPAPFDAATGLAADMVLAAAVSALDAVLIALVAAFIACSAVDMVLADEVALVAAVVILVAAEVTFAAAEDTVRAAVAWVTPALAGDFARVAEVRLVLVRDLVLAVVRVVARLRDFAGAVPAGLRRAVLRAAVCTGIDLPP